jgi:hypothetical protein
MCKPAGRRPKNTSASADKSGAQANSSSSTAATSQADVSGKHGNAQASSASRLQSGSTVQAELSKPLDVRKNKPGDEVIAKTTQDVKSDGKVVLPKGSRIVGKVTQAQARAKGQDESQLGIAFDHAILKDGTQMPVSFAIQAVGNSEAAASAAAADDSAMMAGNAGGMARGSGSAAAAGSRGGMVGGVGSTAGGVANTTGGVTGSTLHTGNVAGANTATNAAGGLTSTSQGVVGLPGLTLSSVPSSSTTAGSMITSSTSNVRLESGTRMLLRANGQ